MPDSDPAHRAPFDYAIVRVVPRVEREEFMNAGVIVHCPTLSYLGAQIALDRQRLAAFAPNLTLIQLDEIEEYLRAIPRICLGGGSSGPLGKLSASQRFNWLVAPRSHMIQTGAVHAGLCRDPLEALTHLLARTVLPAVRSE